jgi:hypothetical protein
MNGHTHNQQQGGNPLQEPRPETPFFNVHIFYRRARRVCRESGKLLTIPQHC